MKVSFDDSNHTNTMINVRRETNIVSEMSDGIDGQQSGMITHSELMRQVTKERDEARKREEALRDRLALQEAISEKQMQELKSQLRKLQSESAKPHRTRETPGPPSTGRSERKREGKSRDVKELQNTIATLKTDNKFLEEKLQKLTDFVKVASDIKSQAISQCSSKDEEIENLRHELRALENIYDEEVQRRIKIEAETHSLRAYVDYVTHKTRKNLKQKSVQTDTSVPPRFILGDRTELSPSSTSSFASMTATAASWRLKNLEKEFQEETRASKQKFDNTKRSDPVASNAYQKRKSMPDFRRHDHSSSSTSESEKYPISHRKPSSGILVRTDRPATRPGYPQGRAMATSQRRQIRSDSSVGVLVT